MDMMDMAADLGTLRVGVRICILLLCVTTLFTGTMLVYVLCLTQTIHWNVKASVVSIVLSVYVYAISSLPLIINDLFEGSLLPGDGTFKYVAIFIRNTANYGDCFIKWLCAFGFSLLWELGLLRSASITATLGTVLITSFVAYALLVLVSRRMYLRIKDVGLNERYRMAENARAMRMLFWWCAASSARNATVFVSSTLMGWYFIPRKDWHAVFYLSATFDLSIAVYGVVAPLVIVYSHAQMRKHLRRTIVRRTDVTGDSATHLRSVLGKPLIVDVGQHQAEYFKSLRAAWGE
ncbi:hypothetical protein AAVH_25140 [Aphelenchoides avenae]|nr:hypothetical protein AAVH_25140 [Aphelenchus avenae]